MGQGVAFSGMNTRGAWRKGCWQSQLFGSPDDRPFSVFVQANTTAHRKDVHSLALGHLWPHRPARQCRRASYPSLDTFFADLGAAYAKSVRAFADGRLSLSATRRSFSSPCSCDAKYRQSLKDRGDDPDALGRAYGDLINAAMADIPSDMRITMHLCRGNYRSTFMGEGGYEPVADILFNRIKVHGYFMEYDSDRSRGLRAFEDRAEGSQRRAGSRHLEDRRAGAERRHQNVASTRRRNTFRSISFVCRRNAVLLRPKKATR